jgi:hypothetical protein
MPFECFINISKRYFPVNRAFSGSNIKWGQIKALGGIELEVWGGRGAL